MIKTENREICALCGTGDPEILIPADIIRVNALRCRGCRLVFLESRGEEGALDPEETAYWDDEKQKKIYLSEGVRQVFVDEFERRLAAMRDCLGRTGKLLDVGCGVGHFLGLAKQKGWSVRGLDISRVASQAAREAYGLDVLVGTLEDAGFAKAEFDAVTLWDVIEHIRRPVENVKAANRLLRKGGLLVMKTPNELSFFKRMALAVYRLLGRRGEFLLKYVYYIPHYFSYSKKTMDLLLEQCGFETVRYDMDDTPIEFATEKINFHYGKDPKRAFVLKLLPVAVFFARLFKMQNKLVVYARKVREV